MSNTTNEISMHILSLEDLNGYEGVLSAASAVGKDRAKTFNIRVTIDVNGNVQATCEVCYKQWGAKTPNIYRTTNLKKAIEVYNSYP